MHGIKRSGGRTAAAVLLLLLLATGSGCSLYGGVMPPPPAGNPQFVVEDVPFYPQEEYQCGPAALAMALTWSGLPMQPGALVDEVYTPARKGSLQPDMITAARRHGRIAYPITGAEQLIAEVAGGNPVIVLQNLGLSWYPVWHYAMVIGYDQPAGQVFLRSGVTETKVSPYRVFENTWGSSDFWGLLVLPPSRMPVTVKEKAWLEASVGLERAQVPESAAPAYAAAVERWPENYDAWIGLGNARYALGSRPDAAAAFQRATMLRPDNGIAFNNLAQVLAEMGQREKALAAAKKAVACGGPHLDAFRKTLSEIK
ncbi:MULTISPECIES: PA2778 family cysteine peptidase [unclassified Pseudodesulfovibrio]|uniref:PA2778 family cysteine peptidase n=1 Tax=unclassified Pseudodesulfovibrio TaxID=2661612 RepID=UPI000FEB70B2|nr:MULTISPECIES: PA2778 family cysteine peptidase [unclassified Pseudodesulfovibrio]MCJ2165611.1 PA2778 family cysteine peptidase [Pseudodesulfovibrio sp. S3-i]RWU03019.1 peptidase C39 [Pseudodesulfovibrio sp. S3]